MARKIFPLIQGSYTARSLVAEAQRCINLYPEKNPEGSSFPFSFYPTPGLTKVSSPPVGGYGRGLYYSSQNQLFACIGSNIYQIIPNGNNTFSWTLCGSINSGGSNMVSMTDNVLNLVLVDGTNTAYNAPLSSIPNGLIQIADQFCIGGDFVGYLDGFLLFNQINSRNIYSSLDNTLTFDPTFVAAKGGYNDKLRSFKIVHREIWLIGNQTTEVWYDAGNQGGIPFSIAPGTFIQHGTCAPYSVASHDLAVFWLSQDQNGQAEVLMGENYEARKISTPAIDWQISQYSSVSDAIGMTYLQNGHVFYLLTFPSADVTWVYDKSQNLWHQRAWTDKDGVLHRIRPSCMTFAFGQNFALDWESGDLYILSEGVYTDTSWGINIPGADPLPTEYMNNSVQVFGTAVQNGTVLCADWVNRRFFTWNGAITGFQSLSMDSTTVLATTTGGNTGYSSCLDSEGNFYCTDGLTNVCTLYKYNPTTLATLGHFGTSGAFYTDPTTQLPLPTSHGNLASVLCDADYILCVSGLGWNVVNASKLNFAGFASEVSVFPDGFCCAGEQSSASAKFYIVDFPHSGSYTTSHLYSMTISEGANTYNPASWPTANPFISTSLIGNIPATNIDPTWTHLSISNIIYDQTDGNIILFVSTTDSVANQNYVVKLNSTNAAVIWALPVYVGRGLIQSASLTRIKYGLLPIYQFNLSTSQVVIIDTIAGTSGAPIAISGISPVEGEFCSDDVSGDMIFYGSYTHAGGTPVPLDSTPNNYTTQWGFLTLANYGSVGMHNRNAQETVYIKNQMSFIRSFPHLVMGGARLLLNAFFAKVAGGRGSAALNTLEPTNTDPQIKLRYSTNGGKSFGNAIPITLGSTGEFDTQPTWRNLGIALGRDVIFELSWSGPDCTALFGAWLDFEQLDT